MKKIKQIFKTISVALCAVTVLVSCNNLISESVQEEGAYLQAVANTRSALFPIYDLQDFSKYILKGEYPATQYDEYGDSWIEMHTVDLGSWTSYSAFASAYIAIPKANTKWNFTLKAYTTEGTYFSATVNDKYITNGNNSISFELHAIEYAIDSTTKGGLSASIKLTNVSFYVENPYYDIYEIYQPEYSVNAIIKKGENLTSAQIIDTKNIDLTLQPVYQYGYEQSNEERFGSFDDVELFTGNFIATIEKTNLDSGYYWVEFIINKGSIEGIIKKTVLVIIADGKVSTEETSIDASESVSTTAIEAAEASTQHTIYYNNDDLSGCTYIAGFTKAFTLNTKDKNPVILPTEDEISREGYTFGGWYTNPYFYDDTRITEISPGTSYNVSVYLKWNRIDYSIEYNVDSEQGNMPSDYPTSYSIESTEELPEVTPIYSGYEFKGWYTTPDFEAGTEVSNNVADNIYIGNLVLYAKIDLISYTITYYNISDYEGYYNVTMPNNSVYEYNAETSITLPTPSRTGYTFNGWYTNTSYSDYYRESTIPTGSSGNKIYYAYWTITDYIITYVDEGSYAGQTQTYHYNDNTIILPTPTKSGKEFVGWFTTSNFVDGTKIDSIDPMETMSNIIVYSLYGTLHSISYDANNGSMPVYYTTSFTEYNTFDLPIPERTGYNFDGWLDASSGEYVSTIEKGTERNFELTAQWSLVDYTITYHVSEKGDTTNISSYTTSFTIEDSDITLPIPTSTDYTFVGWYTTEDFEYGTDISTIHSGTDTNIEVWAGWIIDEWENVPDGSEFYFEQSGYSWTSNNQNQHSSTSISTWTVTLSEEGYLTILYSVSSEINCDKLTIILDDLTIVNALSGNYDLSYSNTLTSGLHTIMAYYDKDGSVDSGNDTATITLCPIIAF